PTPDPTRDSFPTRRSSDLLVTWTFDDGHGNVSTAQQRIVVTDTIPPVVPVLADVTGQCAATITVAPTTTDNCAGPITGTTSDALARASTGMYFGHVEIDYG